jgi:hypothetical protein
MTFKTKLRKYGIYGSKMLRKWNGICYDIASQFFLNV